jgi:ATP-dependent Clp protease ATP-binding subunit ClpA
MFERYTEKARRVIFFARVEAGELGSPYIETEHILLGLLREDKALTARFFPPGAVIDTIRMQVEGRTTVREKIPTSQDLPLSNECKHVLAYAAEEADSLKHKHIGTEHLLLGLLREEKGFAAVMLNDRHVNLEIIRQQLAGQLAEYTGGFTMAIPRARSERRPIPGQGCMEFVTETARVGITALALVDHVPRIGEEVVINTEDMGARTFRVMAVTYFYDSHPAGSPHAPQRLTKILVRVAHVDDPPFAAALSELT